MSGVRASTLSCGMRVVTDTVDTVEIASLGVWVGAGTRNEPQAINGVAHLLEHMAFKGTSRRSAVDIAREIEDVGGQINAYTSREHTAYYAKVLHGDAPLAMDILADILQDSIFDPDELARERAVVLQEIGQSYDTPDDIIFDHFQATAFPDQPLGRPVLGRPEIVESMPRDAIMGHMRQTYGGEAMVLSAAGRVDHDTVVAMAEELFAGLQRRSGGETETGSYAGGDHREDRELEQVHFVLGFPGFGYHDEAFYAASVLSSLFGGGMSSRLFQEIRERRGLAYSIYSFLSYYSDCGLFSIYAGTGREETAELTTALCAEIHRLGETLEEAEVKRARNQLKAATLMALESTGVRCEQMAQQTLIFNRQIPIEEQIAKIEAVDIDAVAAVAARIFAGRPTIAAMGPLDRLADYDTIAAALKQ
ncbi:MAG: pitrilysin family protein [Rhodospirillaceae bacterium]|nr:pitrilysin family protein [Rhodospirillaceae bacterium]MDD9925567.1 pitrilysin family protein [Rhodospirillaceae bacterium]